MAIRVIEYGRIKCDSCEKELAFIRSSRQVFSVLIEEDEFTKIYCPFCDERNHDVEGE